MNDGVVVRMTEVLFQFENTLGLVERDYRRIFYRNENGDNNC